MNLSPISLALTRPTANSFNPASLFAAGEEGAWYDPSDFSTMFQDTAGTIPVTATGQSVFRINDKSGRGHYLAQATATKQPTLQQDSDGKYYLQFDGTNDSLNTLLSGTINLSTSDKVFVCQGYKIDNTVAAGVFSEFGISATTVGSFSIIVPRGAGVDAIGYNVFISAQAQRGFASLGTSNKYVGSCQYDTSLGTQATAINVKNNTNTTGTGFVGTVPGAGNFGTLTLYVGQRNDASAPYAGRMYGYIIRLGALAANERGFVENYMNAQTRAY